MKLTTAALAKLCIYFAAFAVVAILTMLLPELAREEKAANPNVSSAAPYLIGAWALAVPVFMALYQTLKLVGYVTRDEVLSHQSVKALNNIKFCAITFGFMFLLATAAAVTVAKLSGPTEDTAPFGVFLAVFSLGSAIIATSAAVLQRLVENAIQIKTENDFTV